MFVAMLSANTFQSPDFLKKMLVTGLLIALYGISAFAQQNSFFQGTWRAGTEDDGYIHLVFYANGTCEFYEDGELLAGANFTHVSSEYDDDLEDDVDIYARATYEVRYCYSRPCALSIFIKTSSVYAHKKQFNEDGYMNVNFLSNVLNNNQIEFFCSSTEDSEDGYSRDCETDTEMLFTRLKKSDR